ncbi:MAG: argininosuccinate synthase [Planctomycetota bacterium]
MPKRVVLAYSGGLDTSAIVPWLKENLDCEVICYAADVGQGSEELEGIEDKAKASGAVDCFVVDLRREFVRDYCFPTVTAGCVYEHSYLLGTAMARPIIAKAQVEVARQTNADALCHGCTGKGNDQVRFESTFNALAPTLEVIAPWRTWEFKGRHDLLKYLEERNVPTTSSVEKIYSRDRNLWHISHEGGPIEDPADPPPDDVWMLTADPREAPDEPRDVVVEFEAGVPVAVDGQRMEAEVLLERLNAIAGPHGVGRIDIVENRRVGMKSRGLYETPGGTVLVQALYALEQLCYDRDTLAYLRQHISPTFASLVYDGRWFTPLREALSKASASMAQVLTGSVTVRLWKGTAIPTSRTSPHSLYEEAFASFDMSEVYDQTHAEGFIRLASLPERIRALKFGPPA